MEPMISVDESKLLKEEHTYDEVKDRLIQGIRGYISDDVYRLPRIERDKYYEEAHKALDNDYNFYYNERIKEFFQLVENELKGYPFMLERFKYIFESQLKKWQQSEWIIQNFKWEFEQSKFVEIGISKYIFYLSLWDGGMFMKRRQRKFKITIDYDFNIIIKEEVVTCEE